MPFAVSQWPNSPDPRLPNYIAFGWDFGQVSSWKWTVSTTEATGLLSIFNAGVLCHNVFNSPSAGIFVVDDVLPGGLALIFSITGTQEPAGGPPTFTIHINLQFFQETGLLYTADLRATYPTAIQVQSPFVMVEVSTAFGTFPNPVIITPAVWDAD